jgi:hypothetical protein
VAIGAGAGGGETVLDRCSNSSTAARGRLDVVVGTCGRSIGVAVPRAGGGASMTRSSTGPAAGRVTAVEPVARR